MINQVRYTDSMEEYFLIKEKQINLVFARRMRMRSKQCQMEGDKFIGLEFRSRGRFAFSVQGSPVDAA